MSASHMPSPQVLSATLPSPIGELLVAVQDQALCGLWFADQSGIPAWALTAPAAPGSHPVIGRLRAQLQAYFGGQRDAFDLPMAVVDGTDFQRQVWQTLAQIPAGRTVSYRWIAERIGRPRAVRAVGGAVGRNPLGIVLPCHRVLGASGSLTGYTGGLARKRALLALEGIGGPWAPAHA